MAASWIRAACSLVLFAAAAAVASVGRIATSPNVMTPWSLIAKTYPPDGPLFYAFSPQGVAHDAGAGTLIFSGKDILREVQPTRNQTTDSYDLPTVRLQFPMLPDSLTSKGYDHIGDADYVPATGQVLIPIEEPSYTRPVFGVVNRTAGGFTIDRVANATGLRHCPWVAFGPFSKQGFFDFVVSSEYDNVTRVHVYHWPSLEPWLTYELQKVGPNGLMHVQGGVFYNFNLYLTTDQHVNPDGHDVFVFDLTAVVHAEGPIAPLWTSFRRNFTDGLAEVEGLTIDGDGRMWVATNGLEVDPEIYTLQQMASLE